MSQTKNIMVSLFTLGTVMAMLGCGSDTNPIPRRLSSSHTCVAE